MIRRNVPEMLPWPVPLRAEREPLSVVVSLDVRGHSIDWLIDIWLISICGIQLLQRQQSETVNYWELVDKLGESNVYLKLDNKQGKHVVYLKLYKKQSEIIVYSKLHNKQREMIVYLFQAAQ